MSDSVIVIDTFGTFPKFAAHSVRAIVSEFTRRYGADVRVIWQARGGHYIEQMPIAENRDGDRLSRPARSGHGLVVLEKHVDAYLGKEAARIPPSATGTKCRFSFSVCELVKA